jgi:tetratricopeptide (TPR) repeat protein
MGTAAKAAVSAEHLSDHEQFCQNSPSHNAATLSQNPGGCLAHIEQSLALLPAYSAGWYKVKSYQLDYYFDNRDFDTLFTQTSALLQQPTQPDVFLLQLYFYHAKSLFWFKQPDEARKFANLAVNKLEGVFDNFGAPLRLVELANLYYSLNDLNQAFTLLTLAEQQYSKNRDPLFWFELYSNQALVKHQWNDLAAAEALRAKALDAALSIGHNGKLIIAYGNLARTQQLRENYAAAYQNYLQSLPYFTAGDDDNHLAIYQLRLAEISWQDGEYRQAAEHLKQVDVNVLGDYHLALHKKLSGTAELLAAMQQNTIALPQ